MSFLPDIEVNEKLNIKFLSSLDPNRSLEKEIGKSDGVIFEYFPAELEKQLVLGFIAGYGRHYKTLLESVVRLNKTAYAFDPAHEDAFICFSRGLIVAGLAGAAFGSIDIASSVLEHKVTRRDLLTKTIKTSAGLVIAKETFGDFNQAGLWPNESAFRRLLIARAIVNTGRNLREPTNLLLVYPDVHIEGIQRYLLDRPKLEEDFSKIAPLKTIPYFADHYFQGRIYRPLPGSGFSLLDQRAFVSSTFPIN